MRNSIKAVVFGSLLATMVVSTGAMAQANTRDVDNATVVQKKTVVRGDDRGTVVRKKTVVKGDERRGDVRRDTVVRHKHHNNDRVRVRGVWVDAPAVRVRYNDDGYRVYRHHNRPYYYQNGVRVYYRSHRDHDRRDWGHSRARHHGRDHWDNDRDRNVNDRNVRIQNRSVRIQDRDDNR